MLGSHNHVHDQINLSSLCITVIGYEAVLYPLHQRDAYVILHSGKLQTFLVSYPPTISEASHYVQCNYKNCAESSSDDIIYHFIKSFACLDGTLDRFNWIQ